MMRRSRRLVSCVLALVLMFSGCKSNPVTVTKVTVTVTTNPSALSVAQGSSGGFDATITASGEVTGLVNIQVDGAPSGVTATAIVTGTSGLTTTAHVTVVVGSTTPGTYPITVHATGSGINAATATFTLTVTPQPAVALVISPESLSVQQGGFGTTQLTITRTNFTGDLVLTAENLPSGVTASFSPASPISGTSSTLTLTATGSATLGLANVTIRAHGNGPADATAPLALTVTPRPTITVVFSPAAPSVAQAGTTPVQVTFTRVNFTGSVTFVAESLPTGVTASFNPSPVPGTGTATTLTLGATGGAIPGTYTASVRASGSGMIDVVTPISITVTATLNATVDFSLCAPVNRAVWFAFQDGSGTWTPVTGSGDVYRFGVFGTTTAAIAFTQLNGAASTVNVQYYTATEIRAGTIRPCPAAPTGTTLTLNGTFANIYDYGYASIGGVSAFKPANGSFQMTGVPSGTYDLFAFTAGERGFIVRALTPTNNSTLPTVDFQGVNAFDALFGDASVSNPAIGEAFTMSERYYSGTGAFACTALPLNTVSNFYPFDPFESTVEIFGVPVAKQLATDWHQVFIQATTTTSSRSVAESFHTFLTRITTPFVLPTLAAVPTVTTVSGTTYKRLSAVQAVLPAEYNGIADLMYMTTTGTVKTVLITATSAWRNGAGFTLTTPDFTGVTGWLSSWAPASGDAVTYSLDANGSSGANCAEGTRQIVSSRMGTK